MDGMKAGLGSLVAGLLVMGCGLPQSSDAHGGGHSDTTSHGHSLDQYGGPVDPLVAITRAGLEARGMAIFKEVCVHCHQEDGQGLPGMYPPLATSDYLMADRRRPVGILLKGLKGPITVNGVVYDFEMPAVSGSDLSIATVLTYVRNQFNAATDSMTLEEVKSARKELGLPASR